VWQRRVMRSRTYRLEVESGLTDLLGWAFHGTSVMYDHGNTLLVGLVRDQAELHGLLQRFLDLGLTLVSVNTIDHESDA
jgi:hypothetical protein